MHFTIVIFGLGYNKHCFIFLLVKDIQHSFSLKIIVVRRRTKSIIVFNVTYVPVYVIFLNTWKHIIVTLFGFGASLLMEFLP